MLKSIVIGAAGRMGHRIIHAIHQTEGIELVGAVEYGGHAAVGADIGEIVGLGGMGVKIMDDLGAIVKKGDVIIDFTTPTVSLNSLKIAAERKVPIVIGSTGFSNEEVEEAQHLSKDTKCVLAPNMSIGVNLLFKIVGDIATILGNDYDIEIVEAHHRFKKDSPSGTAVKIGQIIAETLKRDLDEAGVFGRKGIVGERTQKEIGIHAVRAGDIVGEHTVTFGGLGERIEIVHKAHSRDTFARGAVRAAKWIVDQKNGMYDMQDVLGLK